MAYIYTTQAQVRAAPDLLAAAEGALELWDDLYSNMAQGDGDEGERDTFAALRAAIAKAKGQA